MMVMKLVMVVLVVDGGAIQYRPGIDCEMNSRTHLYKNPFYSVLCV